MSLAGKLHIKPGNLVLVLGAPDGYLDRLQPLPEGAEMREEPGEFFDVIQAFVRDRDDLDEVVELVLEALKPGGILWMCYPKRSSRVPTDLTRDTGWDPLYRAGRGPVGAISIDEVWSGLRFGLRPDLAG
jgi:hypothetical protein